VWTGDQDNPWRETEITVAIEGDTGQAPQVREALDYWEKNSERYAGYPLQYELAPDAESPDMVVAFVERIDGCGIENDTAGCAPVLNSPFLVDRPVRVRVRTGFSDESTVRVLKHELGHTLGLNHSDDPREIMASHSILTTPPQPNATERALPWADPELTVHVDYGDRDDRDTLDRQVREALDYYDRGADGTVPENVSFRRVDDPDAADVEISFVASDDCTRGTGSCGSVQGDDPDGDGALETYTTLTSTLVDIDADAAGWHVAYWLGFGFGFDEDSDYPPRLRDASYEERRSDWWN
jgi:hypothetical protein